MFSKYFNIKLVLVFSLFSTVLVAQKQKITVAKAVDTDNDKYVAIFKDIHENPELGFMEVRTAGIIAKELKSYGYKVTEKIGITGVAGVLKNGNGPIVMYRADMDCNAVLELTDLPYKSTKIVKLDDGSETPVTHACGHDVHVTWMLAAAKFMSEHKNLWKGTVIFIGQPAEEPILGAEAMVNDGLYTKHKIPEPDYLFGIHSMPISVGMIAAASGVRMAGTDQFDVTFHGIGGHGSNPHLSKDPILMAASAIMQYQAIISRGIDAKSAAVITVGSIQAGKDNNVIPNKALLKVNLRWFTEKDRRLMIDGITRINEGIAHAYDLPKEKYPTIKFKGWSYPLENNTELTKVVRESTYPLVSDKKFVLDETVVPSVMGSEDVHHLVINNAKKDYAYINVGIANPKRFEDAVKKGQLPFNNHNGNFEVDLSAISFGSKVAITAMLAIFNQ
ncbi:amidohydrolase [Psychroserpens burtonensis]|uniref:Amidohydrolase n=1 Tax=Psychroserpens burtonensis TaxID=49278 RepID=A0A5C7B163_9FLAO|nr:amidohydrolase [Psychroserpens burtonensis]TXE14920.1 amidohydrolase [Psychroserpens burtonensis]